MEDDDRINSRLKLSEEGVKKKMKLLIEDADNNQVNCIKLQETLKASQEAFKQQTEALKYRESKQKDDHLKTDIKRFLVIIDSLNLENRLLLNCVVDLMREKSSAQCKGLVMEQIADMAEIECSVLLNRLSHSLCEKRRNISLGNSHSHQVSPKHGTHQNLSNLHNAASHLNLLSEEKQVVPYYI